MRLAEEAADAISYYSSGSPYDPWYEQFFEKVRVHPDGTVESLGCACGSDCCDHDKHGRLGD